MSKNIVICCDGTGNEFGRQNSNVVKLYEMLVRDETQMTYYHPGVGTIGARSALTALGKWWTRVIGLAFGYGISDNIADAYQFLMKTFEAGDRVYVFGFSRGAYTARALCGMLHVVGLITEGNEGLIPYAIRMIKRKRIDFTVAGQFKKTFSRQCQPHFVGVWDTVSSIGWVYDVVRFPYINASSNPDFHIVRHAVSIDERRAFFRQNLFGEHRHPQQDIREVWFAGVHSDVGGSYPEPESQLSKIALKWMICEAERIGLLVDTHRKDRILGGEPPFVAPDPTTKNQHKSLHGWWWIAEFWPKIVHVQDDRGEWKNTFRLNLGRRRWIAPGSLIHESVKVRFAQPALGYQSTNLPQQYGIAEDHCANRITPRDNATRDSSAV